MRGQASYSYVSYALAKFRLKYLCCSVWKNREKKNKESSAEVKFKTEPNLTGKNLPIKSAYLYTLHLCYTQARIFMYLFVYI